MKKTYFILGSLMALFAVTSCSQKNVIAPASGNMVIANAVVNGATLSFNRLTNTATIGDNSSTSVPILAGQTQIQLFVTSGNPVTTYYNQTIPIVNAGNYSLFLGGVSPSQIDPVLITETYHNYTDSLCGVRFINLSANSSPVSVNISGQANGSEVTSLAYKAYSTFKQYPAKVANSTYAFQIRDAATGNLIVSYTLNTPYFHNVTIMLRGLVGGSPGAGITLVQHP